MPNILSLGFHFSKWEIVSTDIIVERNRNFTKFGFPVDYFWLDLEYTNHGNYLEFNENMFPMQ